jgi:hypothetical protein
MAVCGNCGAESKRCRVIFDERNSKRAEECAVCHPENFSDAFMAPSDRRLWWGQEVYPNRYKLGSDGILHASDELIQDTVDQWSHSYEDELKEKKRATRNTVAMTPEEIKEAVEWGEKVLRPSIEKQQAQAS